QCRGEKGEMAESRSFRFTDADRREGTWRNAAIGEGRPNGSPHERGNQNLLAQNALHDTGHDSVAALAVEHVELSRFGADLPIDPGAELRAGAVQADFYIFGRELEAVGRFLRTEVLDHAEREYGPQFFGERIDRLGEQSSELAAASFFGCF